MRSSWRAQHSSERAPCLTHAAPPSSPPSLQALTKLTALAAGAPLVGGIAQKREFGNRRGEGWERAGAGRDARARRALLFSVAAVSARLVAAFPAPRPAPHPPPALTPLPPSPRLPPRPALALLADSLGPAAKFVPSSTHFFLAAVIAATVLPAPAVTLPALPAVLGGGKARRGAATPTRRR